MEAVPVRLDIPSSSWDRNLEHTCCYPSPPLRVGGGLKGRGCRFSLSSASVKEWHLGRRVSERLREAQQNVSLIAWCRSLMQLKEFKVAREGLSMIQAGRTMQLPTTASESLVVASLYILLFYCQTPRYSDSNREESKHNIALPVVIPRGMTPSASQGTSHNIGAFYMRTGMYGFQFAC